MFGMRGLILTQLSFDFRESNANFTDLSVLTVITTGDTKQSRQYPLSSLGVWILLVSLILVLRLLVGVVVPVELFVSPGNVRVVIVSLFRCLLSFHCFRINPEICV